MALGLLQLFLHSTVSFLWFSPGRKSSLQRARSNRHAIPEPAKLDFQ
jgi:hypothetical protein